MLQLTIPAIELWDEKSQEFVSRKEKTLQLEHSLVSISKWESKWHKPFLSKIHMTDEETVDYIRCMTITQNVDSEDYNYITDENIKQVQDYIESPMTATWFKEEKNKNKSSNEQVTNELIYYWMIALGIPIECQKWHLNRLLTLIRVCSAKNQPAKKMSQKEIMSQNKAINEARKKRLNSKG